MAANDARTALVTIALVGAMACAAPTPSGGIDVRGADAEDLLVWENETGVGSGAWIKLLLAMLAAVPAGSTQYDFDAMHIFAHAKGLEIGCTLAYATSLWMVAVHSDLPERDRLAAQMKDFQDKLLRRYQDDDPWRTTRKNLDALGAFVKAHDYTVLRQDGQRDSLHELWEKLAAEFGIGDMKSVGRLGVEGVKQAKAFLHAVEASVRAYHQQPSRHGSGQPPTREKLHTAFQTLLKLTKHNPSLARQMLDELYAQLEAAGGAGGVGGRHGGRGRPCKDLPPYDPANAENNLIRQRLVDQILEFLITSLVPGDAIQRGGRSQPGRDRHWRMDPLWRGGQIRVEGSSHNTKAIQHFIHVHAVLAEDVALYANVQVSFLEKDMRHPMAEPVTSESTWELVLSDGSCVRFRGDEVFFAPKIMKKYPLLGKKIDHLVRGIPDLPPPNVH